MWNGRPTWRPYAAACVDATCINPHDWCKTAPLTVNRTWPIGVERTPHVDAPTKMGIKTCRGSHVASPPGMMVAKRSSVVKRRENHG